MAYYLLPWGATSKRTLLSKTPYYPHFVPLKDTAAHFGLFSYSLSCGSSFSFPCRSLLPFALLGDLKKNPAFVHALLPSFPLSLKDTIAHFGLFSHFLSCVSSFPSLIKTPSSSSPHLAQYLHSLSPLKMPPYP